LEWGFWSLPSPFSDILEFSSLKNIVISLENDAPNWMPEDTGIFKLEGSLSFFLPS